MLKTEPRLKWHSDMENEPMENLHQPLSRNIIMLECWKLNQGWSGVVRGNWTNEKVKIGIIHCEKMEKFGFLLFWVSTEIENWYLALWKKWKMATILWNVIVQQNFQLLTWSPPPKLGPLLFWMSMEMENWLQPLWQNGCHYTTLYSKISNYQSPKVWFPAFPSVNGNGISHLRTNCCHIVETCFTKNFQSRKVFNLGY